MSQSRTEWTPAQVTPDGRVAVGSFVAVPTGRLGRIVRHDPDLTEYPNIVEYADSGETEAWHGSELRKMTNA